MIAWVSSQGMRLLSIKQGHGLYLNHSLFQYSLHSIWRIPCGELIVCQMTKSKKKNNTFDQKGFQSVVKKDTERQTCWRTFPVMIKASKTCAKTFSPVQVLPPRESWETFGGSRWKILLFPGDIRSINSHRQWLLHNDNNDNAAVKILHRWILVISPLSFPTDYHYCMIDYHVETVGPKTQN